MEGRNVTAQQGGRGASMVSRRKREQGVSDWCGGGMVYLIFK